MMQQKRGFAGQNLNQQTAAPNNDRLPHPPH
jgi:hypothetical protein